MQIQEKENIGPAWIGFLKARSSSLSPIRAFYIIKKLLKWGQKFIYQKKRERAFKKLLIIQIVF